MHPKEFRKLVLEAAKPRWEAAIAAAAALGSAAISSNAQQQAASKAAGAAAVPKGGGDQGGFKSVASGLSPSNTGDALSSTFSAAGSSMAGPQKTGFDNIDIPRINDALGKTSLASDQGSPAPVPGSAAAQGGGQAGGGSSSSLINPQTVQAVTGLVNAFRTQPAAGGGIPQPGQTAGYTPTASAAMQRLQQIMAQQRGGGGYGGYGGF